MKTPLKTITAALIAASLQACSGGTSELITTPAVAKACDAVLYREVTGSYNGRIEYQSPDWVEDQTSCGWEVSMSVIAQDVNDLCRISFDYQSEADAGSGCANLSTTGDAQYDIVTVDKELPQWPVEIGFRSNQATDVFSTYAPGQVNVGGWESVFDGRGNVEADQVSGLSGWSGVLVRYSDQPFQKDDGSVL